MDEHGQHEQDEKPEPAKKDDVVITEVSKEMLLEEFNNLLDEREKALHLVAMKHEDLKKEKAELAAVEAAIFEKAREIRNGARPLPLLDNQA